jgi:hypothetical protein
MIPAYPLQWPAGWPRTPWAALKPGKFGTMKKRQGESWDSRANITIFEATTRVLSELARMGIDRQDVVISTNLQLRLDGLPRSGQAAPRDAGAAVYWQTSKGERRVMAIDQYWKVEENLAAIAATLDAMRAIERHGGAQILDRAFTGFTALPAPASGRDWQVVLELSELLRPTLDDVKRAFRRLSMQHHPDRPGGSHDKMAELNAALAEAEKEIAP